jgi:hypothetical protein
MHCSIGREVAASMRKTTRNFRISMNVRVIVDASSSGHTVTQTLRISCGDRKDWAISISKSGGSWCMEGFDLSFPFSCANENKELHGCFRWDSS